MVCPLAGARTSRSAYSIISKMKMRTWRSALRQASQSPLTRTTNQAPGQRTGRLAVAIDDGAGDDGRVDALGPLQQPLAAGRQVVGDLRRPQAHIVVVQHVDVGLHPDPQQAAI